MILAERSYAAGMAAPSLQASIDSLTAAGEWFPWSPRFRSAQALQLFAVLDRVPDLKPAALTSLRLALAADPGSVELASRVLLVERALGICSPDTAAHLLRLAPRSEKAQEWARMPCKQGTSE